MKNELRAVPLVRQIRATQYEELRDMSWEERIAYYKAKALALHEKLRLQQEKKDESIN